MRIPRIVVALLVSSFLWSSSAMAGQQHIVDPAAMRQAIADQAASDQRNREAVLGVLATSPAREVAAQLGLNVARAESAVATLDGAALAQLADTARTVDLQLAGGSNTVVISTTTLLLILIIVILVAR